MPSGVALLTAAAHKGGKEIGLALAADGYDVVVSSEAMLRGRAAAIRATGRQAEAFRNVTYEDSELDELLQLCATLGPLTLLVHVAPDHVPLTRFADALERHALTPEVVLAEV